MEDRASLTDGTDCATLSIASIASTDMVATHPAGSVSGRRDMSDRRQLSERRQTREVEEKERWSWAVLV